MAGTGRSVRLCDILQPKSRRISVGACLRGIPHLPPGASHLNRVGSALRSQRFGERGATRHGEARGTFYYDLLNLRLI